MCVCVCQPLSDGASVCQLVSQSVSGGASTSVRHYRCMSCQIPVRHVSVPGPLSVHAPVPPCLCSREALLISLLNLAPALCLSPCQALYQPLSTPVLDPVKLCLSPCQGLYQSLLSPVSPLSVYLPFFLLLNWRSNLAIYLLLVLGKEEQQVLLQLII